MTITKKKKANPTDTAQTAATFIKRNGAAKSAAAEPDLDPQALELRGLIEAVQKSHALIEFGLDGTTLTANQNFLTLLGYRADELQGKNQRSLLEPTAADGAANQQLWSDLNAGRSRTGEAKYLGKGGKELWLLVAYHPILDADGRPTKIVAFVQDLSTVRAQSEEIAEYKVRNEITNLTSIVSESDLKGDILSINEKFVELSQYSRQELIGHPHNTTRHPDMPKETFKELWATIGRGKTFRGIIKNRKKDGTPYYVDAVVAPVLGENGKPKKYIGVRYDITSLEIERQNMKGILSAIDSTYAYIEFTTKGTVLSANANFQKALGYPLDEIAGKHHRMFVSSTYANSPEYAQFWNDLNAGISKSDVFQRFTKQGHEIFLQAVYAPVKDEMGRVTKVIKIATDITAAKAAEARLKKAFEAVAQNATTLGSAAEELSANSQQMVSNAEETATQAGVVSAAAEQVSKNVQTVATGTEEMSASIKEIAKNAQDAAKVASVAVKAAETANNTVSKLGESSSEIGKVIKVITSIAQQTNLLALNATIEAARAGEAGKGFAVVANEVKELAKETAKATEDISQKIEAIQGDTKSAIMAIAEISAVIGKINDYQNTIASAVEEQTATTNEISRNVSEAAKGSTEIAQNITGVATAAKSTTSGANDTQMASAELSRMAAELQAIVEAQRK